MWKPSLAHVLRSLRRHRAYTSINVVGLAVSLTACLIVALFVLHKLSYDRFHERADHVYRVVQRSLPLMDTGAVTLPRGLAHALERELPEIEHAAVLFRKGEELFSVTGEDEAEAEGGPYRVESVFATEPSFFDVFSFSLLRGDPEAVLAEPGAVVLTASTATALFGEADPIGRVITVPDVRGGASDYRVTGIAADVPGASHFRFDALYSLSPSERAQRYDGPVEWGRFDYYLYFRVHAGAMRERLQAKVAAYEAGRGYERNLLVEPLTRIHLHSDPTLNSEIAPQSDVRYLYLFSVVGLLVLLVGCVNYVNLATARATMRAREVGVRKVVGAGRAQLTLQFLGESLVLALLSLPIALGLAHLVLPLVSALIGDTLILSYVQDASLMAGLLGLVVFIGLAAGSYPALFLSSFDPAAVLYGRLPLEGRGRQRLRHGLVAFQFAVSVALTVAMLVVYLQMDFVRAERLGPEETIVTFDGWHLGEQAGAFKAEVSRYPQVVGVTAGTPPGIDYGGYSFHTDPATGETISIKRISGDADYLRTLGLRLLAGEGFRQNTAPEGASGAGRGYLINERAAALFGVGPADVGTLVDLGPQKNVYLRGIVADFHHRTLHEPIQPLLLSQTSVAGYNTMMVRLRPDAMEEGLERVAAAWARFTPERPFDYNVLGDQIAAQYGAEERLLRIFGVFCGLAVFIAALGLFGLAAFMTERRTREIGVRKVLGASTLSLVSLLARDLLRPALLAWIVGMPVAYFAMQYWLENYAYRIELSWWIFAVAGLGTLAVGWLTVSYQSIRAALANPVESLRYE